LRGFIIDCQVFPHFIEPRWANASNGLEVIHAFERAVGFSRLEDFIRGDGANTWNLLEFLSGGRIEVDGVQRRFLLGTKILRRPEHKDR